MSGDERVTNFEEDLAALEAKVEALQRGGVGLEEAIRTFEEGVRLYRRCSEALRAAEQRVTKLVDGIDGVRETAVEG